MSCREVRNKRTWFSARLAKSLATCLGTGGSRGRRCPRGQRVRWLEQRRSIVSNLAVLPSHRLGHKRAKLTVSSKCRFSSPANTKTYTLKASAGQKVRLKWLPKRAKKANNLREPRVINNSGYYKSCNNRLIRSKNVEEKKTRKIQGKVTVT